MYVHTLKIADMFRETSSKIDRDWRFRLLLGCFLAGWLGLTPALAAQHQPLSSIRQAAADYVKSKVADQFDAPRVEVGSLDPRLKLRACDSPLHAFEKGQSSHNTRFTVAVRCNGPKPWTLYLPATVHAQVDVLAARGNLPRGTVLKASDLQPISRDIDAMPYGFFQDPDKLVGMETKRFLRAGDLLTPGAVDKPELVRRGASVTVVAEIGSARVVTTAKALESGAMGERIEIENQRSKRVIEAVITGRDQVLIRRGG